MHMYMHCSLHWVGRRSLRLWQPVLTPLGTPIQNSLEHVLNLRHTTPCDPAVGLCDAEREQIETLYQGARAKCMYKLGKCSSCCCSYQDLGNEEGCRQEHVDLAEKGRH